MAKCVRCGKKGLFLKLSGQGLCPDCLQSQCDQLQAEKSGLQAECGRLTSLLTPEHQEAMTIGERIKALKEQEAQQIAAANAEIARLQGIQNGYVAQINQQNQYLANLQNTISERMKTLAELDKEMDCVESGFIPPHYEFETAEKYKLALDDLRAKQKQLIKYGRAVAASTTFTVDGDATKGKKLVQDTQKLLLRAFNTECDETIRRVKASNYNSSFKKIDQAAITITKLGTIMKIAITNEYFHLKLDELRLAYEYQQKKQQEKDEQKALRAQMREEAKAQKELEAARLKAEKEQSHYHNALASLKKQIAVNGETAELLAKKAEIEKRLTTIEKDIEQLDYRQANAKAGYVYVISNIGSFGKDVYKIGMTRRLDPMERVDELGDASVPFDFDVHAMIFTEDAPKLEAALHNAFADRKVNMVNTRREFFRVTLDEIKAVVRENYDKTANFQEEPEADQYYQSEKMRHQTV